MIHQAAAGKAGHPLYLADGLQQRYPGVLSWTMQATSSSSVLTVDRETSGRLSMTENFYHLVLVGVVSVFVKVRMIRALQASSFRLSETNRDESER